MSKALKKFLFDAYGGFGDKRIKNLDKGRSFIIDDREPGDQNSSCEFNFSFCFMFAEVAAEDRIKLILQGNVPLNSTVAELAESTGNVETQGQTRLYAELGTGDGTFVRKLAKAIRAIVAPGAARYPVKSYKYVAPRVAKNLERFADELDKYHKTKGTSRSAGSGRLID